MNKISNFSDITYVINNKVDIKDSKGYDITFIRFLSFSVIEIIRMINEGNYSYYKQQN